MSPDHRAAWALAAFAFALFAPAGALCGLYLDDYTFLAALDGVTLPRLWEGTVRYVPGRNLHMPFHALLRRLSGSRAVALTAAASRAGGLTLLRATLDARDGVAEPGLAARRLGRVSATLSARAE